MALEQRPRGVGQRRDAGLTRHQMVVEPGGPAHRLAGVVHDEVEALEAGEHLPAEGLDARRVPQVDAVDGETIAPRGEVGLARVALRGIVRKARRGDDTRAGTQQHDRRVIADLDARAGHERHAPA